jgi:hypothetical protein
MLVVETELSWMMFQPIQGNMSDNHQVFRCIVETNTERIFTKDDLKCPMKRVFDRSMGASGCQETNGIREYRVISPLHSRVFHVPETRF